MEIVINAVGMPFNGETVKKQSLGGSESAAYYLARAIAALGHRVVMFTTSQEEGMWDGVQYVYCGPLTQDAPLGERFTFYALNTPHDVLIAQRSPLAFHKDYASKFNVWQLHDLALHRMTGIVQGGLPRIDLITTVSDFHRAQTIDTYGLNPSVVSVVRNGVDASLYQAQEATFGPELATQFKMLYQSRPERGLIHLVRPGGIMDRLRDTAAHLYVCGYENTTQEMAGFYEQLNAWARALPNVTLLGALTKDRLAQLQMSCDLMCYPTEFEEVSCITAMEAMCAGLPMLTSAHAALSETCRASGTILLPLTSDGQADEGAFVQRITGMIGNPRQLDQLRGAQRRAALDKGWHTAAASLMDEIMGRMRQRIENPDRVLRHCIEHSDIAFMDWYVTEHLNEGEALSTIGQSALDERRRMFAFIDGPPQALLDHYEKFEGENLDRMEASGMDIAVELESLSASTRFRGIVSALGDIVHHPVNAGKKLRVLEFGCAHGHITLGLAKLFPGVEFVGMDFMPKSVRLAVKYAGQLGIANASFTKGSLDEAEDYRGDFDVVIAAEVLEHIYDYRGALDRLRAATSGWMIFTTPVGRWEWSGREHFRRGREHLHHFDREDWTEILNGHDPQLVYAPFGPDSANGIRGSWVVSVRPVEGVWFGEINYARKLTTLCPRETVSVTMIVKDGSFTIGKALASVQDAVDEIVIAIDPATTDDTMEVIAKAQAAAQWVPIRTGVGLAALKEGFGAARNRTLDIAAGDWVLWMDADEECPMIYNAWRLLRPSHANAYATPQIHYSAMPAAVLTTDYPCRLLRHTRGVRFYGLVHEHPEDQPGKAIEFTLMATDLQFLHNGYVDERTRRARYQRNLPLLLRDVQESPARTLNRFLLLRDLAQGLGFERQSRVGDPGDHARRALEGVQIMHDMIDRTDVPLRMVLDGLQYYSICNDVLNAGFVSKLNWATSKPPLDTLNTSGGIEARFHNRASYMSLVNRILQESTKHYESRYA